MPKASEVIQPKREVRDRFLEKPVASWSGEGVERIRLSGWKLKAEVKTPPVWTKPLCCWMFHVCICSASLVGGAWVCWACHLSFRTVIQWKINRPLMKLLNHKAVKTADRRLRSSQAWLEAYWSGLREALELSHFRLAIHCTTDLGLSILLSLNSPLTYC